MASKTLATFLAKKEEEYDRVIVNAPDLKGCADAYAVAQLCDRTVVGCRRTEITGTDLYEIETTLDNSAVRVDGVVVYGN